MARMSEDELSALADLEIRNSVGYFGGKLAEQRRKANYYYLGLAEGDLSPPEVEGRSSVVFPFIRNTEEAMVPGLLAKFAGSDSVVEFVAQKKDDEDKAKKCTDYLNYLYWKKNKGHTIAETSIRDALRQKLGVVKVWWDTRAEETKEEYKGLTKIELSEIMDDEEVEVTEQATYQDPEDIKQREKAGEHLKELQANLAKIPPQQAQMVMGQLQGIEAMLSQPPVMLYDVTAVRKKKGGKLSIENVPPEEFLISRKAKTIATAPFCAHLTQRTQSELKSMGYKDVDDLTSESTQPYNAERIERLSFDDELAYVDNIDNPSTDESQRLLWVAECYIRIDFDGDGISELRKITKVGNRILDNDEVDVAPFVGFVAIRQPHKLQGLSLLDIAGDVQKTQTSILRSKLDNLYLQVNGRYYAVENQVNLDDLLTSRPGGVVRVKNRDAVGRLDQGASDEAASMGMLEYMEGFGESATGWTRYSQGNTAGRLGQSTAQGMNIIANRDDMRIDLIARNLAEGFRELFDQMLKLVCQHQDKCAEVYLSGTWVDIDPREWRNQFDININVGLGVGSKDQQLGHLMALIGQQEKVMAVGVANPENVYQASVELAKLGGYKNPDKFFTDPTKVPPPQHPNPEVIKGQVQAQVEQVKGQNALQLAQANGQVTAQIEAAKVQAQVQIAREKAQLDAQVAAASQAAQQAQETKQQELDAALEQQKAGIEAQMEAARMQHEHELEMLKQQSAERIAQLNNDAKIVIAQITAAQQDRALQAASESADKAVQKDNGMKEVVSSLKKAVEKLGAPRTIIRDADGRAQGIQ